MDYKYIFFAPFYQNNSNGIKCFWEAALNFSKYRDVTILQFYHGVESDVIPKEFENLRIIDSTEEIDLLVNHIVVYPDCISSNPLQHHNISRYLMCKPFILNGQGVEINKYDYCFAYSKAISDSFDQYTVISKELFNLKPRSNIIKDNTVLIYYGKTRYGLNFKGLQKLTENFLNVKIITRLYPSNKENLQKMISESRLFISLDPLTSLIHESTLLGTPVYVYDAVFKDIYDNFNFKLHGLYYNVKETDLNKIYEDSVNLSEKAHNEIENFTKEHEKNTLQLIENMEDHFLNNRSYLKKYSDQLDKDIDFYKNKFGGLPIFNIGGERNIIRYHIINKYKLFGIMIILIFRIIRSIKIRSIKITSPRESIRKFFTPEEVSIVRKLLKNHNKFISFLRTKYSIIKIKRVFYFKSTTVHDTLMTEDPIDASKYTKPTIFIKYFWK